MDIKQTPRKSRHRDILLTGGAGDVFAVEGFFPEDLQRDLRTVYWAAERGVLTIPALRRAYPGVKHVVLTDQGVYHSLPEVERRLGIYLGGVEDWSISRVFELIKRDILTYRGGRLLTDPVDVADVDLPDRYVAVQGCTSLCPENQQAFRNLLPCEWGAIQRDLKKYNLKGVVLDVPGHPLPPLDRLVDRRGLSLEQGIAVVTDPRCQGYWGIDSVWACVACRHFAGTQPDRLRIRSGNAQYFASTRAYCAPARTYDFVVRRIT